MQYRKLVPVFAAVLLVALSGCGALNSGGDAEQTTLGEPVITSDMSAEEIRQLSANATEGYSSYEMEMNMSVDTDRGSASTVMDGVMNLDEKKAKMDMSVDAVFRSVDTTAYIDDQTVYVKNPQTDEWRTQPVQGSSMNWEQTNQLEQQRELLSNSEISLAGSTTIDEIPMTVISIEPDSSTLQEVMAQQQGTDFDGTVNDMTMKMYVSNQTGRVRKMTMDATMTTQGETMEMDMIVKLSNYGTDTNIQIPDA